MSKSTFLLALLLLVSFCRSSKAAQIWADTINVQHIFLDTTTTVLGQLTIDFTTPGKVEVHFDGECEGDTNDMIVLASSNHPDWDVNDGNIGVFTENVFAVGRSFSHSRFYTVTAGQHTFYAVGQNYVCNGGNGYASVYGMLTVIFHPDTLNEIFSAKGFGSSYTLDNGIIYLDSININPSVSGTAVVHIDGSCAMDEGDRVYLGMNTDSSWTGIDPIHLETHSASVCFGEIPFSYTLSFPVSAGQQTFYALAENMNEMDGNGNAWISWTFSIAFYPNGGQNEVGFVPVNASGILLNNINDLAFLPMTTAGGAVYVHGDGVCSSDSGDWNVFAVSDSVSWFPNFGCVKSSGYDNDVDEATFSHTLVFKNPDPNSVFHLVGQNILQGGTASADVVGSLTTISFPDVNVGLQETDQSDNWLWIYPNPANDHSTLKIHLQEKEKIFIQLFDINGKFVNTIADEFFERGNHKFNLMTSGLQKGIYFVRILSNGKSSVRKLVIQ